MTKEKDKTRGIVAEFDNPEALLEAAAQVRDAGYTHFDCHSPFPIHGMDEAMGLKRSPLGWIVGTMALTGAALGMYLQYWTSAVDYKLVISGKPFFSYQAFVPITFGIAVLFGAFSAILGMLALNKLPRLFHPVFFSEKFTNVTRDGFYISIEAHDPQFDEQQTRTFLKRINARDIEVLREPGEGSGDGGGKNGNGASETRELQA